MWQHLSEMTGHNSQLFIEKHLYTRKYSVSHLGQKKVAIYFRQKRSYLECWFWLYLQSTDAAWKSWEKKPYSSDDFHISKFDIPIWEESKKSQHFQDCLRKEMDSGAQVSVLTGLPGALGPWRFRVIGWPVGISITSPGDGVPSRSVFKHICLPLHGILTILLQVSY